jgi:hypothetical protein
MIRNGTRACNICFLVIHENTHYISIPDPRVSGQSKDYHDRHRKDCFSVSPDSVLASIKYAPD